jgi:hypothetical protein
MVILAAAVLGAAGYGAYKGGDAAVKKGRDIATEHQRNQKRREQSSEFKVKAKTRQERIANLTSMRTMESSSSSDTNTSSDSQRHQDVIASFRARQESAKGGGLKGLFKRGGK